MAKTNEDAAILQRIEELEQQNAQLLSENAELKSGDAFHGNGVAGAVRLSKQKKGPWYRFEVKPAKIRKGDDPAQMRAAIVLARDEGEAIQKYCVCLIGPDGKLTDEPRPIRLDTPLYTFTNASGDGPVKCLDQEERLERIRGKYVDRYRSRFPDQEQARKAPIPHDLVPSLG